MLVLQIIFKFPLHDYNYNLNSGGASQLKDILAQRSIQFDRFPPHFLLYTLIGIIIEFVIYCQRC